MILDSDDKKYCSCAKRGNTREIVRDSTQMEENVRGQSRESTETMERKFTEPGSTWKII